MHLTRIKKTLATTGFLVFSLIFWLPAQAQHGSRGMNADGDLLGGSASGSGGGGYLPTGGWAIAVNGGYEAPLGDLKDIYKGAPTFGVNLSKRWKHFIFLAGADYRNYQPKQATYTFDYDYMGQTSTASATYSNFTGLGIFAGVAYEMPITNAASFYVGLNGGVIMSKYNFSGGDGQFFDLSVEVQTNIKYVGPKLGLNFALTNRLALGVEARYNLSPTGASSDESTGITTDTSGFKSVAGGLSLSYSF